MIDGILARRRAQRMLKVLAHEREVLLSGPFSDLEQTGTELDDALGDLMISVERSGETISAELEQIRQIAARNQKLLEAAIAGARSVENSLNALEAARKSVGTYTELGDRLDLSTKKSEHERRA